MASGTVEVPTDAAAADVAAKGTPAAATVTDTVEASPSTSPPKGVSLAGALEAESSPETVVEEEEELSPASKAAKVKAKLAGEGGPLVQQLAVDRAIKEAAASASSSGGTHPAASSSNKKKVDKKKKGPKKKAATANKAAIAKKAATAKAGCQSHLNYGHCNRVSQKTANFRKVPQNLVVVVLELHNLQRKGT